VKGKASIWKKKQYLSTDTNIDQLLTTRIRRPRAFGGKLRRNLARTPPLLP
jgi:hypothetical protein